MEDVLRKKVQKEELPSLSTGSASFSLALSFPMWICKDGRKSVTPPPNPGCPGVQTSLPAKAAVTVAVVQGKTAMTLSQEGPYLCLINCD